MSQTKTLTNRVLYLGLVILSVMGLILGTGFMLASMNLFSYERFVSNSGAELQAQGEATAQYFQSTLNLIMVYSVILVVLLVVIGGVVYFFLLKRMMRPLKDFSQTLDSMDTRALPGRIDLGYDQKEIITLQNSFNSLLNKLNNTLESQKRFVQNAAHELKTPITSIMTNIEVLEMDNEASKSDYEEVVNGIKESTYRMHALIKDLFKLSDVRPLEKEPFDLKSLTLLTPEMKKRLEQRNIVFEISGNTKVHANKALFERAMQNLVENAIRYNVDGGFIKIEADETEVVIRDNGIGIPREKQTHIFEPFYCVDESRSKTYGGTGLGLSIVSEIMKRHGFSIELRSEVNEGTTFTISLNS